MGAIKKMVEEELPGIYVLSLMIGKTVVQVLKLYVMMYFTCFLSICLFFFCQKRTNTVLKLFLLLFCYLICTTGHRKWIFHGC